MTNLNVEIHEDVMDILNKIKAVQDPDIILDVPEGALLFENVINIRLLEKEAERLGKNISIETSDIYGERLMSSAKDATSDEFASTTSDPEEGTIEMTEKKRRLPFALPVVALKNPLKSVRRPRSKHKKFAIIALVVLLLLSGGGYKAFADMHRADIVIDVKSQPLTKSIQITVDSAQSTSAQQKTLKGYVAEASLNEKAEVETTGEKVVGEPASGKVIIYNKTTSSKKFNKGTTLIADKEDLEYELDETVTVPARTEKMDGINIIITPGSAEGKIVASEIGSDYNIDDEEDMEVDDYSKSEVSARTQGKISGGKSETIKVVTEEDKLKAKTETEKKIAEIRESSLNNAVLADRVLVQGSTQSLTRNELYSAEIDEEADKLELTQEVSVSGLTYSKKELEELMEQLLDEFIPEGYTLSSKEMNINAEVLGRTETTVLSPEKADLQVTIKTYVITDVKEEQIKKDLAGKSLKDGQALLDKIQNINNYSLNMLPNLPFLKKFPSNTENIHVEIKRS